MAATLCQASQDAKGKSLHPSDTGWRRLALRSAPGELPAVPDHKNTATPRPLQRHLWVMLLTLLSGFALSQAFRT
ncbi:MAG: hypothetical protein KBT18_05360, partial [Comamonas sp.]|nr:hypothetical protein [Candidatus Comamonas equi]